MEEIFRTLGREHAEKLRAEAAELTGTQIIDREVSIPAWKTDGDYSLWPVGAPVTDEGQVWILLQPHNAAHYNARPAELRALWGLAHTTEPAKAKPWATPMGTSGMYMAGECYRDVDGDVWRCRNDNTAHSAAAYPAAWELVSMDA